MTKKREHIRMKRWRTYMWRDLGRNLNKNITTHVRYTPNELSREEVEATIAEMQKYRTMFSVAQRANYQSVILGEIFISNIEQSVTS